MQHKISEQDPDARTGLCAACGPNTPLYWRPAKQRWVCAVAKAAETRHRPPQSPELRHARHLRTRFGITAAEYDALAVSQAGTCAICQEQCMTGRRLAVDHDHESGLVRGLLCGNCNRALGLMKDSPERLLRAVQYLTR